MIAAIGPAKLSTLPARPPTPPKESLQASASADLKEDKSGYFALKPRVQTSLNTPNESPSSSAELATTGSGRLLRRVEFSPWTSYQTAPVFERFSGKDPLLKPLPPSRERTSSKSILKPSDHLIQISLLSGQPAHKYNSFAQMLESVVQQLAGGARAPKIDAYGNLSGTLKAYDGVPDLPAMAAKMDLLTQFLRRDMTTRTEETGSWDTTLITQALKLLMIFLSTRDISACLSDDFRAFVLDHSTQAIQDASMPKILINHYMHILATQRFSPKVMTAERANRLMLVLRDLEDRFKGNGIIGQRLMIYEQLLRKAKSVLVSHTATWMEHVLTAMLSSIKDIRMRAIHFGTETGFFIGTNTIIAKSLEETMERTGESDTRFIEFFRERLIEMLGNPDEAEHVPQIWSVVVLFSRRPGRSIEGWKYFKDWLHIIQRCLNNSHVATRFHAYLAWDRLIYVVAPSPSTSRSMIKMLRQPINTQLEKKGDDKQAKQGRQWAFSCYCHLLYYSLRPNSSNKQLDLYWDEYVVKILTDQFFSSAGNTNRASRMLAALLWTPRGKIWREDNVKDASSLTADQLPTLDSKWLRTKTRSILAVFERLFDAEDWQQAIEEQTGVAQAWSHYVKSLADAGRKEIKTSTDTMQALADFLGFLYRTWERGSSALGCSKTVDPTSTYLHRFGFLLEEYIRHVGVIPFTETKLQRSSHAEFQLIVGVNSKFPRADTSQKSPLHLILELLCRPPLDLVSEDSQSSPFSSFTTRVLKPFVNSKSTKSARLQGCHDLATQVSEARNSNSIVTVRYLWSSIVDLTVRILAPEEASSSESNSLSPADLRIAVGIMKIGLAMGDGKHLADWDDLYQAFRHALEREALPRSISEDILRPVTDALRVLPRVQDAFPPKQAAAQAPVAESVSKTTAKATTPRRLRHDDSQIQFTTVESSPTYNDGAESQLTDRQREVRERQRAEAAAMFPDIRSDPISKKSSSKLQSPKLTLQLNRDLPEIGSPGPSTPTLPPPLNGPMDDFIGSSPTPRSSSKNQDPQSDDIDVPSSPPCPDAAEDRPSYPLDPRIVRSSSPAVDEVAIRQSVPYNLDAQGDQEEDPEQADTPIPFDLLAKMAEGDRSVLDSKMDAVQTKAAENRNHENRVAAGLPENHTILEVEASQQPPEDIDVDVTQPAEAAQNGNTLFETAPEERLDALLQDNAEINTLHPHVEARSISYVDGYSSPFHSSQAFVDTTGELAQDIDFDLPETSPMPEQRDEQQDAPVSVKTGPLVSSIYQSDSHADSPEVADKVDEEDHDVAGFVVLGEEEMELPTSSPQVADKHANDDKDEDAAITVTEEEELNSQIQGEITRAMSFQSDISIEPPQPLVDSPSSDGNDTDMLLSSDSESQALRKRKRSTPDPSINEPMPKRRSPRKHVSVVISKPAYEIMDSESEMSDCIVVQPDQRSPVVKQEVFAQPLNKAIPQPTTPAGRSSNTRRGRGRKTSAPRSASSKEENVIVERAGSERGRRGRKSFSGVRRRSARFSQGSNQEENGSPTEDKATKTTASNLGGHDEEASQESDSLESITPTTPAADPTAKTTNPAPTAATNGIGASSTIPLPTSRLQDPAETDAERRNPSPNPGASAVDPTSSMPAEQADQEAENNGHEAENDNKENEKDQDDTSPQGILASLRRVLGNLKSATLGRTEHREIHDLVFEVSHEASKAAMRGSRGDL